MFKRISAIFIVITLMLTILPGLTFAAGVSRSASKVKVNITSIEADCSDSVKFTVTLRDSSNQKITDSQKVYVASSRGYDDEFYASDGTTPLAATGQDGVFETPVSTDGKIEFRVKSSEMGIARIGIGITEPTSTSNSLYKYLKENGNIDAASVGLIDIIEINFTEPTVEEVVVNDIPSPSEGVITGSGTKDDPFTASEVKGDLIEDYEITFQVNGENNTPIPDQKIVFSTDYPQVSFDKTSDITDDEGQAFVRIYASEGGKCSIKATVGDKSSEEIFFSFAASDPVKMVMSSMKIDALVPTGTDKPDGQYFKLYDRNDNLVRPENLMIKNVISFEWVTQPDGSNLEDDWAFDTLNNSKLMTNQNSPTQHMYYTSSGYVVVKLPEIQEKGDYVLKINLKNHESVEIPFKGGEFGEVTKLELKYDAKNLPLDSMSLIPDVYRYNAEGLSLLVDDDLFGSEILFAVSDIEKLDSEKSNLNTLDGKIFTPDDADKKGKITITAVDTENNLTATFDIEIKDNLADMKITGLDDLIPVATKTTASIKLVDLLGEEVSPGDLTTASLECKISKKPEGSKVYIQEEDDIRTGLEDYGYCKFDIYCDEPGEVIFIAILSLGKYENDGVTIKNLTFIKEITTHFGSPKKYGAEKVVMFIGNTGYYADGKPKAMDAEPFIKENRTYLPLRAVADELEAETEWDEKTQTIKIKREDKTVTVTIGSSMVKISDGPEYMADGEPLIIDGRTFVPFRVIGEAFGVTVNPVLDSNNSVIGIEFSQEKKASTGMMGR